MIDIVPVATSPASHSAHDLTDASDEYSHHDPFALAPPPLAGSWDTNIGDTISVSSPDPMPSAVSMGSTNESPIVPAQIYAEFFRPGSGGGGIGGTNGVDASIVMPLNVGFTPPLTTPGEPSQATYNVK